MHFTQHRCFTDRIEESTETKKAKYISMPLYKSIVAVTPYITEYCRNKNVVYKFLRVSAMLLLYSQQNRHI